jgi:hypothetical protein
LRGIRRTAKAFHKLFEKGNPHGIGVSHCGGKEIRTELASPTAGKGNPHGIGDLQATGKRNTTIITYNGLKLTI